LIINKDFDEFKNRTNKIQENQLFGTVQWPNEWGEAGV
jgi:hypothetical protein